MKKICLAIAVAAVLWFAMFSTVTKAYVPFWPTMTASGIVLTCLAFAFDGRRMPRLDFRFSNLLLSIGIAVALWIVFFVGDKVSQLVLPFARTQVDLIYGMKGASSPVLISAALLLIIGPAEELFWRGYIQRNMSTRFGATKGYIIATLCYTAVHLPSGNLMLIMAAMTCGIVWGGLYRLMPQRFTSIMLSHALWDAAAFVWFPF